MDNEIYKPPTSDVDSHNEELEVNTVEIANRNAKFVLLALIVTPIVTSLVYCAFTVFLDLIRNINGNAENLVNVDVLQGILIISLGVSFVFSLAVGLPLNLLLTKINRLKLIYFVIVGGLVPIFFSFTASDNRDFLLMILMGVTGSVCLGIFWYVAAYLPSRQRP